MPQHLRISNFIFMGDRFVMKLKMSPHMKINGNILFEFYFKCIRILLKGKFVKMDEIKYFNSHKSMSQILLVTLIFDEWIGCHMSVMGLVFTREFPFPYKHTYKCEQSPTHGRNKLDTHNIHTDLEPHTHLSVTSDDLNAHIQFEKYLFDITLFATPDDCTILLSIRN